MNARQRQFAENYARDPNATKAAMAAGYSEHTAYSQGNRLLKNDEVKTYIQRLQEEARRQGIADIVEVQSSWTEILRGRYQAKDRMRAGELLARSQGAFLPGLPVEDQKADQEGEPAAEREADQEPDRYIIYLPVVMHEPGEPSNLDTVNAVRLPDGTIVPISGHENDDVLIYADLYDPSDKWIEEAEIIYAEDEDYESEEYTGTPEDDY